MGIPRLTIVLLLLFSMSVGCDSCVKDKEVPQRQDTNTTDVTPPDTTAAAATICNGTTCAVVIRIGAECRPVDASNMVNLHANAEPGNTVCFFNDNTYSITLSIPTGMIENPAVPSAPNQEFTLTQGQCANVVVPASAANLVFPYTITGECSAAGTGHGNPDVKIGGGEEGGG